MMANVEEYKVKEVNGVKVVGPMKWIILILGPNHQAKDIKPLLETEYKNLNIIVILVTNPVRQVNKNQFMTGVSVQMNSNAAEDADIVTKNLNSLTRLTPEGYMMVIEQRQFEGRENFTPSTNHNINQTLNAKSFMTELTTLGGQNLRNVLSKDIEKIFARVCQSIELYKTDNIPIITEFLEF